MTAEEHAEDSRTKDDSIPDKSSDSFSENKVKKRRVRKKKPRKQDSEYGEESENASVARKDTDAKSVSDEVKIIKRRNKTVGRGGGHGFDNGSCRHVSDSENPDIPGQFEREKYGNRRNRGIRNSGPDIGSASSAHVNDGEISVAAGSVENVKYYVKKRNKVVGNCARIDSEHNPSRRILNSNDTPELSSTAGLVRNAETHEELVASRDGSVKVKHPGPSVKDTKAVMKANKVVTRGKANDLSTNSHPSEGGKVLKRRNKIVSSSCANEEGEKSDPSSCSLNEGVKDRKRLEKVVNSRNVDDTGENPGKIKDFKQVQILKRGPSSSPVGSSVCMVLDQNKVCWDHVAPRSRDRPSRAHNRDDFYPSDVTQAGVTQGCNPALGRRGNEVTKASTGMECKKNTSRDEATEEYAKSRSPGNFPEDVSARGWEKLTRDSVAIGKKPKKDHRRVYTTPKRRSFHHEFEKDLEERGHVEIQRSYPIDYRTKSDEPENPEHEPEEEGTAPGKSKTICVL